MNNQQAINLLKGLEKSLDDYCELNNEGKTAFGMAITALELFVNSEQLPPVQPERKTGHWIPVTNGRGGHRCDRCGSYAPSYKSGAEWLSNFCPECNADMRGETE